jgi:serine/threonine protein kinase
MITVGLNDWDARLYFIDMLKALEYCHETIEVIHRDIKPENIMINHNNEAVLIDFGVSAIIEHQSDELTSKMGSYMFFAPEIFQSASSH